MWQSIGMCPTSSRGTGSPTPKRSSCRMLCANPAARRRSHHVLNSHESCLSTSTAPRDPTNHAPSRRPPALSPSETSSTKPASRNSNSRRSCTCWRARGSSRPQAKNRPVPRPPSQNPLLPCHPSTRVLATSRVSPYSKSISIRSRAAEGWRKS